MTSLWSRALNRVLISLALVAGVLVPGVVNAPAAHAYVACPSGGGLLRPLYERTPAQFGGDDEVWFDLRCDGSGRLYVTGTIKTGDLPANHCFEAFHNVDFNVHRAPEMVRLCTPWTTTTFNYPMLTQDGTRALAGYITDLWRKTTALCITAQWDYLRVDGWTCSKGTQRVTNEPMEGVKNHYNGDTYAQLLANPGTESMRLRGLHGIMINSLWASERGAARCIDVMGNNSAPGTDVHSWPCDGNAAQRWSLVPHTWSGQVYIERTQAPGICLDLDIGQGNGGRDNGVQIQTWGCHGGDNQRWWVDEYWGAGRVRLQTWAVPNRCIDLDMAPSEQLNPGADIESYQCHDGSNQKWLFS